MDQGLELWLTRLWGVCTPPLQAGCENPAECLGCAAWEMLPGSASVCQSTHGRLCHRGFSRCWPRPWAALGTPCTQLSCRSSSHLAFCLLVMWQPPLHPLGKGMRYQNRVDHISGECQAALVLLLHLSSCLQPCCPGSWVPSGLAPSCLQGQLVPGMPLPLLPGLALVSPSSARLSACRLLAAGLAAGRCLLP